MLGDQVYADEVAPATEEFIRARRDVEVPPGPADLRLRGVLPAVPRLVVRAVGALAAVDGAHGDDLRRPRRHRRLEHVARLGGGDARPGLVGRAHRRGLHVLLVLPAPRQPLAARTARRTPATARCAPPTATRARSCATSPSAPTARWPARAGATSRDIGRTRLVVMDSRAGRVLEPGARSMVDAEEWDCIVEWTRGDFDHLLLGTSLPAFLGRGMHFLEAWNEAVSDGAWGRMASRGGRAAAPGRSTSSTGRRSATRCARSSACSTTSPPGEHGSAPGASILLSGDVHHAYIADARPTGGSARLAGAGLPGGRARRCATRWTPTSAARSSWR